MEGKLIKIGIVDDHSLIRDALTLLIQKANIISAEVTMSCENGKDMIEQLIVASEKRIPDIFIIDISMPFMGGFETASWLKENHPNIHVIIFSMRDDAESILRMIKLGVMSYITKEATAEEILEAIKDVNDKEFHFTKKVLKTLIKSIQNESLVEEVNDKVQSLTIREIQYIKLVCEEYSNKEIAEKMLLSVRTVEGLRLRVFEKLDVKNTVSLIVFALKNNIIKN